MASVRWQAHRGASVSRSSPGNPPPQHPSLPAHLPACLPACMLLPAQAIEAARVLVDELELQGQLTPEQFLADREEALDEMFPTAQLLPGAGERRRCLTLGWCAVATSPRHAHAAASTRAAAAGGVAVWLPAGR